MAVKYCTQCGYECPSDANYCPMCGHPFSGTPSTPTRTNEGYATRGVVDYETKVIMFMGIPTVKYALHNNSEIRSALKDGWEIYSIERPEGMTRFIARLRRRRKA